MATFGSINVHDCRRMKASASFSMENPDSTWLTLHFDDGFLCSVSLFMPMARAEALAKAINDAESDYAEMSKPAPSSYVGKDHWTQGDAVPGPDRVRPDANAEHRLGMLELLGRR